MPLILTGIEWWKLIPMLLLTLREIPLPMEPAGGEISISTYWKLTEVYFVFLLIPQLKLESRCLRMPPSTDLVHPDLSDGVRARLDDESWKLPLLVSAGKLEYPLGGIGMDPEASESKDVFDQIRPPRLGQYMDINFEHPEFFAPHFYP